MQNIKITSGFLLLTAVAALLVGCGGARRATVVDGAPLRFDRQQVWQLVSLRGKAQPTTGGVTLVLDPETGTLHGRAACNRYFADVGLRLLSTTAEGSRYELCVSYVGHDDVRCPEADMAAEERYLALLPKADGCLLADGVLTLFRGSKEMMKFEVQ